MSTKKKSALGRGLSALLANSETDITAKYENKQFTEAVGSIAMVAVDRIEANPFQPRQHFDKEALLELSNSIREHGIIQPITVRKVGYGKYQLISGERRFKASQIAGLTEVPVYIRIANDQAMLEMALIENIQRENLDSIEVAIGYRRLIEECALTQEQLSDRIGKDRSTVTNYLRLLKLPAEIQLGIREKKISMGHARALLGVEDETRQIEAYNAIVDGDLSVRAAEQMVRDVARGGNKISIKKPNTKPGELSFEQVKAKEELTSHLNTKVDIQKNEKGVGRIVIEFKSENDLNRIIHLLDV
jgi:ParB family chromosome partitioning protein